MDDVIQYQDQFYILATSSLLQERRHVLKDGDSFAVFDMQGDVAPFGAGEQGYFHGGTRHLSLLRQTINGQRPLLLSSRVREQNDLFGADLTNPDQVRDGVVFFPRDLLHIYRSRFLWDGHWYERLRIANYGLATIGATLMVEFGADYADIFEVRGIKRERRGTAAARRRSIRTRCGWRTKGSMARCARPCCCFDPAPTELDGRSRAVSRRAGAATGPHSDVDDPVRGPGGPRSHAARTTRPPSRPRRAARARRQRVVHAVHRQRAVQRVVQPVGRRHPDDDERHADRARTCMPACRGSARRSAATASSRRSRRSGSNPDLARGTLAYLAATQATAVSRGTGRRARQDPARDAQRRDGRASARCRSAATTAASTRRRCS